MSDRMHQFRAHYVLLLAIKVRHTHYMGTQMSRCTPSHSVVRGNDAPDNFRSLGIVLPGRSILGDWHLEEASAEPTGDPFTGARRTHLQTRTGVDGPRHLVAGCEPTALLVSVGHRSDSPTCRSENHSPISFWFISVTQSFAAQRCTGNVAHAVPNGTIDLQSRARSYGTENDVTGIDTDEPMGSPCGYRSVVRDEQRLLDWRVRACLRLQEAISAIAQPKEYLSVGILDPVVHMQVGQP